MNIYNKSETDIDLQECNQSSRPSRLDEFAGQSELKQNLSIYISAAKARNEALDHTLFNGPPGLGKTTLARIIAYEMNAQIKIVAAPAITKIADLAAVLANLTEREILFIDEIHRLNKVVEEMLYSALEDYKIDILIGEGPSARILSINLAKFTLIGATTRIGMMSKPLRDRFGIIFNLGFYSIDELAQIIIRYAKILNIECSIDNAKEIALRSRGTPRIALRLVKRIRDFINHAKTNVISSLALDDIFTQLSIDSYGLEEEDRRYLKFIMTNYGANPVGIETIAAALSAEQITIEDYIEPYLLNIGFIQRTPRGRILNKVAMDHLV